jgi:UDP-GlcNAc:undecaprenyl-phosphate GlcNAc-1-phosphate transferase
MTEYIIILIVIFFLSLVLASFLFSRYIIIAKVYNLYELYNQRASHKGKVITGSGILLSFMLVVASVVLNKITFLDFQIISPIVGASILISFLGFYDDFQPITAFHKSIILSFLIGMTVYSSADNQLDTITNLHGFLGIYKISYLTGFFFTCFVYLAVINAVKLMDGIDAYLAIFSSMTLFLFTIILIHGRIYSLAIICTVFVGGLVIFMRFNLSKKQKLFFGSAGSLFIGFWIAYFLVFMINSVNNPTVSSLFTIRAENVSVLAVATINIPVFDTIRVMLIRVLNKRSPFVADKSHLHHVLLDFGYSHTKSAVLLCLINVLNLFLVFVFEPYFLSETLTVIFIVLNIFWFAVFQTLNRRNNS